jgi:hypothetical protein
VSERERERERERQRDSETAREGRERSLRGGEAGLRRVVCVCVRERESVCAKREREGRGG